MNTNETKRPNAFDTWWSTLPPACNRSKRDCYTAWQASREILAQEAEKTDEELVSVWQSAYMNHDKDWKSPVDRKLDAARAIRQALLPDIAKWRVGVTVKELADVFESAEADSTGLRVYAGIQAVLDRLNVEAGEVTEKDWKREINRVIEEKQDIQNELAAANKKISELEARLAEYPAEKWAVQRAAHKSGQVIEARYYDRPDEWEEVAFPAWDNPKVDFRVKPEPELVPLEAQDVKPGDAFRAVDREDDSQWFVPLGVLTAGICLTGGRLLYWHTLKESYERTQDNGKTWHPCSKPKGGRP